MALRITDHDVNGVTVLDIDGRIVLGEESNAFRERVKALMAAGKKKIAPVRAEWMIFGVPRSPPTVLVTTTTPWSRRFIVCAYIESCENIQTIA